MGETWRYRYPITSFVQQALLSKSRSDGRTALAEEELILLTASTFWSATARGELHAWFRGDAESRIRAAHEALTAIGAIRMAGVVRANAARIARMQDAEQFAPIEDLLLRSEDQIEELTARYAARLTAMEDGESRRPDAWLG